MKNKILLICAFLALSSLAFAKTESEYLNDAFMNECDDGSRHININGAKKIAREASMGRVDYDVFEDVWDDTCSFLIAKEVATIAKSDSSFYDLFDDLFDNECDEGYSVIDASDALIVAKGVKAGTADKGIFLTAWNNTCNASGAWETAQIAVQNSSAPSSGTEENEGDYSSSGSGS